MFPAITSAVKSFLARREEMARPISLELKGLSGGVFFDMVDTGWYGRTGSSALYSMFAGGAISWSGEAVSVATALNHSVVWACNRLISESIGMIPAVMLLVSAFLMRAYPLDDKLMAKIEKELGHKGGATLTMLDVACQHHRVQIERVSMEEFVRLLGGKVTVMRGGGRQ